MTLDSHHRPQNETAPAANRGGNRDGRIDASMPALTTVPDSDAA